MEYGRENVKKEKKKRSIVGRIIKWVIGLPIGLIALALVTVGVMKTVNHFRKAGSRRIPMLNWTVKCSLSTSGERMKTIR